MVLLNILYGLIMALVISLSSMLFFWSADFNELEFLGLWGVWTVGHIIYDLLAYRVVKLFNKDHDVYRG